MQFQLFCAAGIFGFEQQQYTVNEGDGFAEVCLIFFQPSDPALIDLVIGDIFVDITITGDTAQGDTVQGKCQT